MPNYAGAGQAARCPCTHTAHPHAPPGPGLGWVKHSLEQPTVATCSAAGRTVVHLGSMQKQHVRLAPPHACRTALLLCTRPRSQKHVFVRLYPCASSRCFCMLLVPSLPYSAVCSKQPRSWLVTARRALCATSPCCLRMHTSVQRVRQGGGAHVTAYYNKSPRNHQPLPPYITSWGEPSSSRTASRLAALHKKHTNTHFDNAHTCSLQFCSFTRPRKHEKQLGKLQAGACLPAHCTNITARAPRQAPG